MNRITVIQKIIDSLNAKTYLEIGVENGLCFLNIKARKKIAVDPKFLFYPSKFRNILRNPSNLFNEYFEIASDDFFKSKSDLLLRLGLDVVFIDGLHTYNQSLNDFNNSLKYLNDRGVIVMHDCNPLYAAAAHPANSLCEAKNMNLPGWKGEWSGDTWKTITHLRSTRNDLNIFVLDCDFGLGIITKGRPEKMLKYSINDLKNFSYYELENNRNNIINLKNLDYFEEFINKIKR